MMLQPGVCDVSRPDINRINCIGSLSCKLSSMKHEQPQPWNSWPRPAQFLRLVGVLLVSLLPAAAQDIRGIEVCTAEMKMERRTGCLQANVEFLQQALIKLTRETQDKIGAVERDHVLRTDDVAS